MEQKQKKILGVTAGITVLISIFSLFLIIHATSSEKSASSTTAEQSTESQPATVNSDDKKLSEAQQLVKSYHYDEAIKQLADTHSARAKDLLQTIKKEKEQLVKWDDPTKIAHLFFHSLIVDPAKAFQSQQAQGYKEYMVTIPEFNKTIEQLYKNNYVLVNLPDLVTIDDQGKVSFVGVSLPKNKKPLVLSEDDVSYYEYMKDSGFPDKLIIDKDKVKNVYVNNKKEQIGDFDMVPLIDTFVEEHPDFSYQGAKGTLALTGYNGVLGYRTSKSEYGDNEKTNAEIKKATKVAEQLKKDGWTFASHTWGHLNMTNASLEDVKRDNELWQNEVAPILGKTTMLIYPFGADISDWHDYTAENQKFDYLKSQGFSIFCNVDASTPSWGQLGANYYRQARINIDGIRFDSELSGQNNVLEQFINVPSVVDKQARGLS